MKTLRTLVVGAAASVAFATAALAAVTFDSNSGTGFVGKGDVQLALGLNNPQMQAQAGSLNFTYSDIATYDIPCMKEAGRQVLRNSFERDRTLLGTVAYDARSRNQVNGFNLNGYSATSQTGNVVCPGGWEADGAPVLVSTSAGQLKVNQALIGTF